MFTLHLRKEHSEDLFERHYLMILSHRRLYIYTNYEQSFGRCHMKKVTTYEFNCNNNDTQNNYLKSLILDGKNKLKRTERSSHNCDSF